MTTNEEDQKGKMTTFDAKVGSLLCRYFRQMPIDWLNLCIHVAEIVETFPMIVQNLNPAKLKFIQFNY